MKIGILTYHRAHNYGAVLQCYALKQYLQSLGHTTIVVDYKPSYFHYGLFVWYKWLSLNPFKLIKKIRTQCQTFPISKKRYDAFDKFIEDYLSPKYVNLNNEQDGFDAFVLGSDQIWRKNGDSFDPVFWGDFKAAKHTKLISYAASMGRANLSVAEQQQVSKWLKHFSSILVREDSLKALLSPLSEKEVEVVVDPTLLLPSQEWNRIAIKPKYNRSYVLVYQVIENPATLAIAKEAAKRIDADIIEIASKVSKTHSDHQIIYDASPREFLGWVSAASIVVTTSFHGTAFSIIFSKPFVCIKQNKPSDLRISSILTSFNLKERFVDANNWSWKQKYLENPIPFEASIEFSKEQIKILLNNENDLLNL